LIKRRRPFDQGDSLAFGKPDAVKQCQNMRRQPVGVEIAGAVEKPHSSLPMMTAGVAP